MLQRRVKLIREFVSRAAHPATVRAAALNHELRDYTVKDQSIVKRPLLLPTGAPQCFPAKFQKWRRFLPLGPCVLLVCCAFRIILHEPDRAMPLRTRVERRNDNARPTGRTKRSWIERKKLELRTYDLQLFFTSPFACAAQ